MQIFWVNALSHAEGKHEFFFIKEEYLKNENNQTEELVCYNLFNILEVFNIL